MKIRAAAAGGLLLLCAATAADAKPREAPDPRVRKVLGHRIADVIAAATRVEIVAVDLSGGWRPEGAPPAPPPREEIGGYHVVDEFRVLDGKSIEGMRSWLLDPHTYYYQGGSSKACGFSPGVAVRFWPARGQFGLKPADVLLCFQCSDVAVLERGARVGQGIPPLLPLARDMDDLLRLVAAALPEDKELAGKLEEELTNRGQRALFEAMFPASLQLLMHGSSSDDQTIHDALLKHASGRDLFVLGARALGVQGADGLDQMTRVLHASVADLARTDIEAGLRTIERDQVAMAGAAELLVVPDIGDKLSEPAWMVWGPRVTEAALIRGPGGKGCAMLNGLANRAKRAAGPLLAHVVRGEIPIGGRVTRESGGWSLAGCAILSLAVVDPAAARMALPSWHPESPREVLGGRAVAVALGGPLGDGAAFFPNDSMLISFAVIAGIRAHPTREGLDLLVGQAVDHGSEKVRAEAEAAFLSVTRLVVPRNILEGDRGQRVAFMRQAWAAQRASWKAPVPGP